MPKLFHGYLHPTTTNPATITTKVIIIKPTPEIAFTKRVIPQCIPVKMRTTMSQPWNHQANQNGQEQPESCDRTVSVATLFSPMASSQEVDTLIMPLFIYQTIPLLHFNAEK